jgi:diguanylate cyclase (GGDEF)-like protein
VVFVDDEVRFLDGLRRVLRPWSASWETRFETSGEAALHQLEKASDCVLVCDWSMPGKDGPALCECLRDAESRTGRPRTYVILLTGDGRPERLAEGLDRGADDFVTKPAHPTELAARIRVGLRVIEAEARARTLQEDLRAAATRDPLTALLNRREAERVLGLELTRVERNLQSLSVCMVDVDHFKTINDRWGHATGDRVLVHVAERLRKVCRSYDSVARWGGEEFLIVLPDASESVALDAAERLRTTVCDAPLPAGLDPDVDLSISVGASSVAPGAQHTIESVLGCADAALYAAKASGRNRVELRTCGITGRG